MKLPHPFKNLGKLAIESNETLLSVNSIFPFDLVPDTIHLDREKLTVTNRTFFRTAKIISIPYTDILNVELEVGPFMGNVKIKTRFFDSEPLTCKNLPRKDAFKLKKLLAGYVMAKQKEEDLDGLNKDELVRRLSVLGEGKEG